MLIQEKWSCDMLSRVCREPGDMLFADIYTKLRSKAEQIVGFAEPSKLFLQKNEYPLPYLYPCNNYMDAILSNGVVRSALQSFSDKYCKKQIQDIKLKGQLVSRSNYPNLYEILQSCYTSLDVEEFPEVYITNQLKGINALSVEIDNKPSILISRKAVISLSDGELKFMIGHELGHILQGNLFCHTIKGVLDNIHNKSDVLGAVVSDMIEIPLNEWYRCSEFTSDRAGLICCRNMEYVYQIMGRIKASESRSMAPEFMELYKIHPLIDKRRDELFKFYISTFNNDIPDIGMDYNSI